MVKGTIKIGKPTQNHAALLGKMGYVVEEVNGFLNVEGSEFVAALDLSGDDGSIVTALKSLVRSKSLLTYGTRITFRGTEGEGRVLTSLPAVNTLVSLCRRLGIPNLSCLITKPADKTSSAPEGAEAEDEFFASLE